MSVKFKNIGMIRLTALCCVTILALLLLPAAEAGVNTVPMAVATMLPAQHSGGHGSGSHGGRGQNSWDRGSGSHSGRGQNSWGRGGGSHSADGHIAWGRGSRGGHSAESQFGWGDRRGTHSGGGHIGFSRSRGSHDSHRYGGWGDIGWRRHGHRYGGWNGGYWGSYGWPYTYFGLGFGYDPWYYYPSYYRSYVRAPYDHTSAPYASIDTDVKPSKATVYLDGQAVGKADDYNGYPQKLAVTEGHHVLTFVCPGYQSFTVELDCIPYQNYQVKYKMQKMPVQGLGNY